MPRFLPSFGGAPLPLSWVSLGDSGRWVVQAPAPYWALPWVLPSRFQCWLRACSVWVYPWLSSLRSFAAVVVTLVICQVLVGLPSLSCCASGLLGPVVFLV